MSRATANNAKGDQLFSYSFLNEHEVAEATAMSVSSVRRWRLQGKGPAYIKVAGVAVRYRSTDLEAWLSSQPSGGEQSEEAR